MEIWDFLENPPAAAAFNMALDEALLHTAPERGRPLLRVYAWDQPSVSFGYFQKFPARLAGQYTVVRRPTGGGVVYHVNDTTYTVIAPPGHTLSRMKTAQAYETLHRAVAAAFDSQPALHDAPLHSPRGEYECFQRPVQGDVVLAGRKLAGGAQRRTKWGLLHQGSIDAQISATQLATGFHTALGVNMETFSLPATIHHLADELACTKYVTEAWNKRTV